MKNMHLTSRQDAAIAASQRAMRRVLAEAYPEPGDHAVLYLAAVVGSFVAVAGSDFGARLMNVVNEQLRPANLQLSRRSGFGSPNHPLTRAR
jgi:hypothetical protein